MERLRRLGLCTLILLFCACQHTKDSSYEYFEVVGESGWQTEDEYFFSSSDLKPITPYSVSIVLRIKQDIKYEAIPLGITLESPKRSFETYVLNVNLQKSSSLFKDNGYNYKELVVPLQKDTYFPDEGVYTYSIRHLSTDSIVRGIIEVGLIIHPNK